MSRTEHVRPEYDPLLIWSESYIRFQPVVMFLQINQLLGLEISRLDELLLVRPGTIGLISDQFRTKKINPLAISGGSDAVRSTTITSEQGSVRRDVEVYGPFAAFEVVPDSFTR